ncbi:xyloside transporter XynT [Lachnospiraceae bacterium KM106-2]|nr:xyloside transporter XynT [Lachnospiraceae bacterium KM106-2]
MENRNNAMAKLSWKEKVSFASGDLGIQFLFSVMSAYLLVYYTNYAGVGAGMVATIMFVSKIMDAFSDIVMGAVQEKTAKAGAKARPWIKRIFIPYGISAILLFSVPDFSGSLAKGVYVFITYNLFCTIMYTMIAIPYNSLGALITQNDKERETIGLLRSIFTTIVSTIINSFTMTFIGWAGGTKASWTIVISVFAVISMVAFWFTYRNTEERVIVEDEDDSRNSSKLSLGENLKLLFQNKYWFITTIIAVCTNFVIAANTGTMFYYLANVVGNPGSVAICGMLLSMPMLVLIPLSQPFVAKIGKRNMLAIGMLIMAGARVFVFMAGTNLFMVYVGTFLFSVGTATAWVAGPMLCDTVEYGEWKTGVRQEGFIMSAQSFGQKVGTALGTAMIGWILAWTGFDGMAKVQSATALIGIQIDYIWLTVGVSVFGAIILFAFYHLDKEYPQIVKELQERNEKAA